METFCRITVQLSLVELVVFEYLTRGDIRCFTPRLIQLILISKCLSDHRRVSAIDDACNFRINIKDPKGFTRLLFVTGVLNSVIGESIRNRNLVLFESTQPTTLLYCSIIECLQKCCLIFQFKLQVNFSNPFFKQFSNRVAAVTTRCNDLITLTRLSEDLEPNSSLFPR